MQSSHSDVLQKGDSPVVNYLKVMLSLQNRKPPCAGAFVFTELCSHLQHVGKHCPIVDAQL